MSNTQESLLGYEVLIFGRFRLDPVQHVLYEGDRPLRLGSRALEILIALAERCGQVVSKQELIARVWPKTGAVQDATLRVHIATLRRALGDGERGTRYVENISGLGYRFVAHVVRREEHAAFESPLGAVDSVAAPSCVQPYKFPVPLVQAIGRAQVVSVLATRIAQRRFVTIVGPGGIGKTTVAMAVAERVAREYEHAALFVDLSTVSDPSMLAGALADTLGVPSLSHDPSPGVISFLSGRSMLLVLDNCEHVIEAAAAMAERILQGAPGVNLLATSREPLRAQSEYVHRLPPLALPARTATMTRNQALTYPAIQLFVERACAHGDSFELKDTDIPVIAEICERLDGNPLAIQLAAARVDLFGVRGLAARMHECLQLLTLARRTALPRHQSLRASLDWSYSLLSPTERLVLCRLALLNGPFAVEAACAALQDVQLEASAVVFDTLPSLVIKSLLLREICDGRVVYRYPDSTRAYALDKVREHRVPAAQADGPEGWRGSEAAA
jgi:predicted ATPase/DNA-binding winged helix-turn-helix (wHTH) protein